MIRAFPRNAVMERRMLIHETVIFVFRSVRVNEKLNSSILVWFLMSVKFNILFLVINVIRTFFLLVKPKVLRN